MSQFDNLLDFEDTGTTNPPKQQTEDPFDPLAAPDSNVNGGGGGDLLDLGFDMQVSSQNGSGKISLEANTNPLYEFSNNSSEDTSNNASRDINVMASEPANPLYELSNDTQTQDLKSSSSNPLYDFLENENAAETRTNGHTEDLLGTTDLNDVDLLGNSGPIISDDSGVTMDANNFDSNEGVINEEQRNGETSEDSDIQDKANVIATQSSEKDGIVNGTSESIQEDQADKGPLSDDIDQLTDQGRVEQEVDGLDEQLPKPEQVHEPVAAVDKMDNEPQPATNGTGLVNIENESADKEHTSEVTKDKIQETDDLEPAEDIQPPQKSLTEESLLQQHEPETCEGDKVNGHEPEKVEPAQDNQLEAAAFEKQSETDEKEEAKETTLPKQEEPTVSTFKQEHVTEEATDNDKEVEPTVEEAESQVIVESQEVSVVDADTGGFKDQNTHDENGQVLNEDKQSAEQVGIESVRTEQQLAQTDVQEDAVIDQKKEEELALTPGKIESESEPIRQEPEPVKQEPELVSHEPETLKQEPVEVDEDSSQSRQTQKQADSSKDPQNEGALKVNGTSEENGLGANDEEPVHFTELSNVRQRFESGASGEEETPQRHHSVKDDYDEGGEFESTPIVNPDVVKETDNTGEELPEVGTAKSLLSKFQELEKESAVPKPSEKRGVTPPRQSKVEYESTPKERLQQYEGKSDMGVFESQPSVNEDVIRYDQQLEEEPVLEKGHAKSIVSKYKEIEEERAKVVAREKKELTPDRTGKVEYVSEPRGQSITDYEVKVEAGVFESTPKVEEDVVRADEKADEILPEEGMAKNLLSKFKQLETEVSDRPPPSPLKSTTPDRAARREFVSGPRGYLEKYDSKDQPDGSKEPIEVVKSDEVQEDIMPEAGSAKKRMERFKELEKQSSSPPVPTYRKEFTPPREASPGKTVAGVLENTPTERIEGVVKSTDVYDTELPGQGTAKLMANKFKQKIESESSSGSPSRGKKEFTPPPEAGVYENVPAESLVVEQRKAEAGVLESQPAARFDVAREHDPSPEVELPERGYAKNMVSKFRQLESESAKGSSSGSPQKYKEFTPPRDTHGLLSPKSPIGLSDGVHPSELPGQYQQQVQAGVYENQPDSRPDLLREADTDWDEGLPAANTAKSMKQRFQEMEEKALKELETPEPVHRKDESLVHSDSEDKGMFITVQPDKCSACEKTVYAMEKLEMNKNIYHRGCFKCSHCSATLTAKTFSINEGVIYCTTHFKQLFARKGNYDEGFGRQQYKKRWVEEQAAKKDATA